MPAAVSSKIKHLHFKANTNVPLKDYARSLLIGKDEEYKTLAEDWFKNKASEPQKLQKDERFKNKGATLAAIRQATKNAKKGKP